MHEPADVRNGALGTDAAWRGRAAASFRGRIRVDALAEALASYDGPTILALQAGNVHSGAFDPFAEAVELAHRHGAWVHVDGAFGLWAAATPSLRHLVAGHDRADSWATDAHKWLNVPYDCGIALCRHAADHAAAMEYAAPYLDVSDVARDPMGYSPEFSRRARSAPVWAAIRQLGRSGVAELVERTCRHARTIADGLAELPGCEILNDVVLNQVLLRFADDESTRAAVTAVQQEGEAWMSPTTWEDRAAIRISVSCWRTSDDDVRRTLNAFRRATE